MRKKGLAGTIAAAVLVIALAVILAVSCFILKRYVVMGGQLFAKNQQVLDLRTRAITRDEFDHLSWKMPGTKILWSVPLSGGYADSTTEILTVTHFSQGDVELLAYFPNLTTVDAQSSTDYGPLGVAYTRYPDIAFRYTVPIAGENYTPDTTTVTPETLSQEDIRLMEALPALTRVDGRGCRAFPLLRQLAQLHPEWEVDYLTSIAGTEIDASAQTLSLTGASYAELSVGLAAMPELRSLTIRNPQADGQELTALRTEYPNVDIHWQVEVFGNTFPDDATEVDISNQPVGTIEDAKQLAALFPELQKLIVDSSGIENQDMAAYREEARSSYKVVWTVTFTDKCKARTDETKFMPIEQGEYYFQDKHVYNLRYCEDMVCIDIGHSTVENIEFAAYMPHLKYLILAWTQVKDITPLGNCKELVYLELDHGIVHDFTPLQGCTALEDLNISDHMWNSSVEPLTKMTWLKNLWTTGLNGTDQQTLVEALPDTRVVTGNPSTASGQGWRCLQNYYDMRDYLGKPYMN